MAALLAADCIVRLYARNNGLTQWQTYDGI